MNVNGLQNMRTNLLLQDEQRHRSVGARTELKAVEFQKHLAGAHTSLTTQQSATSDGSQQEQLTEFAQKWVSQTFFGTLLKQVRNSPFKSELFSGGRGAEAFGPLYDAEIADRISRASGRQLVQSIVKRIQRPGGTNANAGIVSAAPPARLKSNASAY